MSLEEILRVINLTIDLTNAGVKGQDAVDAAIILMREEAGE